MSIEILEGQPWEYADDISEVPEEKWEWFLGAKVGSWRFKRAADAALPLLRNLKVLSTGENWRKLNFSTWDEALEWFHLDQAKWNWLLASEPVLVESDTIEDGIRKGREIKYQEAKELMAQEGMTQAEAARAVGCSRQNVHKHLSTESTKIVETVDAPDWITHPNDRADFKKLSLQSQKDVVARKVKLHRACVLEGIRIPRPVLPPLERVKAGFARLSKPDRDAFDLWRAEQPL